MKKIFSAALSLLVTTGLLCACVPKVSRNSSGNVPAAASTPAETSMVQSQDESTKQEEGTEPITPAETSTAQSQDESTKQEKVTEPITYPIKYDFNSLEKVNDFDGYYLAKPVNMSEDNWLTKFAGGRENTIKFRFGEIIYNNNAENSEVYIELEGKDNSITLIANGARYDYYDNSKQLKRKTIDFLTGKKLEGSQVVKDYSDGKEKIVLIVDYNENGTAAPLVMLCSQLEDGTMPENNFYKIEIQK